MRSYLISAFSTLHKRSLYIQWVVENFQLENRGKVLANEIASVEEQLSEVKIANDSLRTEKEELKEDLQVSSEFEFTRINFCHLLGLHLWTFQAMIQSHEQVLSVLKQFEADNKRLKSNIKKCEQKIERMGVTHSPVSRIWLTFHKLLVSSAEK